MAITVALTHITEYLYDREVTVSPQVIRLRPAPHSRTAVTAYSLQIDPQPHFLNWAQDPQSNWLARVVFPEPVREFRVTVDLQARLEVFNPFDFFLDDEAQTVPFSYPAELREELAPFLQPLPAGKELRAYLRGLEALPATTIDFLVALNQRLQSDIAYTIRMEPGVQSPDETLRLALGSCRDSAWLLVQLLRHLGLAARFVSGYLIQLKADQAPVDGPAGPSEDFTDLHAWCEAYVPGAGWIGLDPTSGLLAGEGHIPLAATPGPGSAAPVSGGVEPCEVEFRHHMEVQRVLQPPRNTRPYAPEQWEAIDALGQHVDERIARADMRLTMGGEPTFVAMDDPQAEEWNTAAVGPTKQARAAELALRLQQRFAPGGLISYGQGKWYPGESLPRWAYTILWRTDEVPVWTRPASAQTLTGAGKTPPIQAAQKLLKGVAQRLRLPADCVQNAYEDPWHFLAEEAALPAGASVNEPVFSDPERRAQLARAFSKPLDEPRGCVLPVQCWQTAAGPTWVSERWQFRRGKLFLIPGDSPVGLRMPLDSLPGGQSGEGVQLVFAQDPAERREALPAQFVFQQPFLRQQQQHAGAPQQHPQAPMGRVTEGIRTAMAVEPKAGALGVFLPPTHSAEDYLALVSAVEDVAAELKLPVRIEGYPAPADPRLQQIKLTPDPGVIEVNVQPAASWEELRAISEGLYEDARQCGLGTEKFLVDGKHTGTGGGSHVVVGGAQVDDSPFLRRPDLVASMVRCWQNHPCLSYLFAGLFIGPTSQSPRTDEARDDNLYELEIALAQLPKSAAHYTPPWLVDRTLRHLLTDLTGNTHRAEICIDKLFSPDSATGRLGLVEFRAFEMPPHAQMNLVQQLLVRALLVWFWEQPYTRPLRRWGRDLHDRFLLPYFLDKNLEALLADLRGAGLDFDPEWFRAQSEFRCPAYGAADVAGMPLELRAALEPWPTMGEEPGGGGTARYVDSSVERLQLRLQNFDAARFAVVCNGRRVPMQEVADGDYVAGIRFRAWQPWSSLHPGIPAHNPLRISVVEKQSQRAVGGCQYHVHHPGGRSYDTFPVNANEAESRRLNRFFSFGHAPGVVTVPRLLANPRHPCTLDLRFPENLEEQA